VNRRDCLLAALVATVWGFNFVVIDWGMDGVPPLLFLALRFLLVIVPAILFVPRPDASWRTITLIGCFMSLGQFGFLYVGMAAGMPPGLAALVLQAQVIFTILIAAGLLDERPTPGQLAGVVLGTVGLVVVAVGRGGEVPLVALLLCLAGALSWGVGNVVARAARVSGGLSLTVWSALVVPVPLLALSLLVDGPAAVADGLGALGWEAGVSTLYTAGLASLLGYGIFTALLGRNPSSAVVPWVLLAPVVAMGSAWALLDQRPNGAEALGGLLLVSGVLAALRPPRMVREARASATGLGVGGAAAEVGERCVDPAGREVSTPLVDLGVGEELR